MPPAAAGVAVQPEASPPNWAAVPVQGVQHGQQAGGAGAQLGGAPASHGTGNRQVLHLLPEAAATCRVFLVKRRMGRPLQRVQSLCQHPRPQALFCSEVAAAVRPWHTPAAEDVRPIRSPRQKLRRHQTARRQRQRSQRQRQQPQTARLEAGTKRFRLAAAWSP